MKKISAILVALVLVAASAITAFAAGINSNEQAILDELNTTVQMKGSTMSIPAAYVNQAENYFNTVDVTAEESKQIIAFIEEGKAILAKSDAENILDLTFAEKQELLASGRKAVGVLGMTMTYNKADKTLTIITPQGETAFNATPKLVTKGANAGTITENPIKPTGSNVNYTGFIALGAAAVVLVAGGTYFVVKTNKKERA